MYSFSLGEHWTKYSVMEYEGNLYGLVARHGDHSSRARKMERVLLVVDMQKDFMPGGPVPVTDADSLVPLINDLMRDADQRQHFDVCLATKDWHPKNHISFVTEHEGAQLGNCVVRGEDGECLVRCFRPHCIAGTPGAEFAVGLESKRILRVFHKGQYPDTESHSGFYDMGRKHSTGLTEFLAAQEARAVCVVGVALEYCVKATVLDSLAEGLDTYVLVDAVRAVDPEKGRRTLEELQQRGAKLVYLRGSGNMHLQQQAAVSSKQQRPAGAGVMAATGAEE